MEKLVDVEFKNKKNLLKALMEGRRFKIHANIIEYDEVFIDKGESPFRTYVGSDNEPAKGVLFFYNELEEIIEVSDEYEVQVCGETDYMSFSDEFTLDKAGVINRVTEFLDNEEEFDLSISKPLPTDRGSL